jgi:Tfp pilus assembly protein PilV
MTVIEIMVGLGLIAIAIMGLNSLAISAVRNNLTARLIDQGTLLARQKMEQVERGGFAAAVPGTTTERHLDAGGRSGGGFHRTTTIQPGALANLRSVTVTVTWADYGMRQLTFSTEIVQ